jgi:type VI secretion system protein ImpL
MVWPNPQGVPGARITAITPEGRSVVLLNETGHFGLKKMIDASTRKKKDGGVFELTWNNAGVTVTANLKINAAAPPPPAPAPQQASGFRRLRLPDAVVIPAVAEAPAPAVPAAAPPATPAPAPAAPGQPAPAPRPRMAVPPAPQSTMAAAGARVAEVQQ